MHVTEHKTKAQRRAFWAAWHATFPSLYHSMTCLFPTYPK
jgi:hypothetical protein